MAIGRKQRRAERQERVGAEFPASDVETALDLLEVFEIAWHDCYGAVTPPEEIIDDALLLSGGALDGLVRSVHLALTDWRDVKLSADELRNSA